MEKYPKEYSNYRVSKYGISAVYIDPDTGDVTRDFITTAAATIKDNQDIDIPMFVYVPAEHKLSLYWPYPGREDYDSFHFARIPATELEEKLANPD